MEQKNERLISGHRHGLNHRKTEFHSSLFEPIGNKRNRPIIRRPGIDIDGSLTTKKFGDRFGLAGGSRNEAQRNLLIGGVIARRHRVFVIGNINHPVAIGGDVRKLAVGRLVHHLRCVGAVHCHTPDLHQPAAGRVEPDMFAIGRVFGPITRSSLILLSAHESKYTIHSTMSKKRRPRLSRSEFPARSRNPQHIDREGGIFKRGGHRRGCHSFLRAISTMTSWDTATPPNSRASTSGSSALALLLDIKQQRERATEDAVEF